MFRKILLVCLSIFVLFCLTGCGIDKTIYYVEMEDEKIVEYTYKELKKIYEENRVNWEENYEYKYVKFTSEVEKVEEEYILFKNGAVAEGYDSSSFDGDLASLKKGDSLTCTGYIITSYYNEFLGIDISNCFIKKNKEA